MVVSNIRQHSSKLIPSDADMVQLSMAVEQRFLELTRTYLRVNKVELLPSEHLNADMLLWRAMAVRHKKGDFRNTEDEKKSVRRIAEWTLEENCKLKDQKYVPIEWGD